MSYHSHNKKPLELDLHGKTVTEAIELLDYWLSNCIIKKLDQVRVVHGLGTGKVKNAVHQRLAELSVVKRFQLCRSNPGATDVYL